jgi:hypothetical protein
MMTAIEAGHISVLGDGRGAGLTRALAPIGRTLRSPRIERAPAASVDSAKGHRWGFGPAPLDRATKTSRPPRGEFRNVSSRRWRSSRLSRSTVLPFRLPHHVLRPRDRCRTITPLLLFGVLPEPVHATLSEAEMSTIMHLARVPGKELPQEVPFKPIPVCPPPAIGDLHDAHSHPGFTMRQHSAHVENPPVPCGAFVLQQIVLAHVEVTTQAVDSPAPSNRPSPSPPAKTAPAGSVDSAKGAPIRASRRRRPGRGISVPRSYRRMSL